MSEYLNPPVIGDWDDQQPEEYFQTGGEPLPPGWAHLVCADVDTGVSKEKKTPFGDYDLVVKNGRPEYFGKDGKPRHCFVRLYTAGGMVKFVRGLYEKAMALPTDPERKLGTAYLKTATGKEFVARVAIELGKGEYRDRNILAEFHPVTPEWLAYIEEDKQRAAGVAPKSGKKKDGAAGAAIPSQRSGSPMIG